MENSSRIKALCFTGHRDIEPEKVDYVRQELRREIKSAIADGFEYFISGFAEGVDQWAAEIVLELKAEHPHIRLEAAIPYRNRIRQLQKSEKTANLLRGCGSILVWSENYAPNCFMIRNRAMLKQATRLVAVYDKRYKGGTAQTIRFARAQGKEIHIILV